MRKWGYIVFQNDGAIIFQVRHNATTIEKPKLLDQLREAIRTKHYSMKTEKTYVQWIKKLIFFHHKRHPKEMGEREVNQFLTRRAVNEKVSVAWQNQVLCAKD